MFTLTPTLSHTDKDALSNFYSRYPKADRDQAVYDVGMGNWDAVLMTKLAIFNPFPSTSELQDAWKDLTHAGTSLEKFAAACEFHHGTKMFGLVRGGKISEAAVDCFLQLLGWDAAKQVQAAHLYTATKPPTIPRLQRKDANGGVPYSVACARVRVYGKLYTLALEQLENAQWVAPRAAHAEKKDEEEEEDEPFSPTCGKDLLHTVHQYDMYNKSLQKVCENEEGEDDEIDEGITPYAKSIAVPSLAKRLLHTLGRTKFETGKEGECSSTRMVLLTSPPFGYGLSEYDSRPDSDAEWAVRTR
jgi:hypothetical protein